MITSADEPNDAGMLDLAENLRLVANGVDMLRPGRPGALDRDDAIVTIAGAVDKPHPAPTERILDPVRPHVRRRGHTMGTVYSITAGPRNTDGSRRVYRRRPTG